jgi:hypothetical protein
MQDIPPIDQSIFNRSVWIEVEATGLFMQRIGGTQVRRTRKHPKPCVLVHAV